ncbi:MAG: addiction module antidote protein [Bdellovibrionales bacterium]|jgi:probable addiction module antidote protein
MTLKLTPYDTADFLENEEMIQSFLEDALSNNDPAYLAHALGVVARARGMTKVAKDANLSRESLYKALSPDGNPALNTILRVLTALGMRLSVAPLKQKSAVDKRKRGLRTAATTRTMCAKTTPPAKPRRTTSTRAKA